MPDQGTDREPDPLGRVVRAVSAVAGDLDGVALAEALWLAARTGRPQTERPEQAGPEPPRTAPSDDPKTVRPEPAGRAPAPEPERALHERLEGASARLGGVAVAASRGAGLPLAQPVTRALRPWKRPWPRGRRSTLDIEATVEGYARSGELIPVFRPAPERWFGLVLVVDRSPAMRVWREVISDLTAVLDRLGAFRTLQVRELGFGPHGPELRDGLGRLTGPGELRSPDARRLVVVVSDCAAAGWREPAVWRRIRDWSATTPVALLNPLPPKLWRRTALDLPSVRVQPGTPGADNLHLPFEAPLLLPDDDSAAEPGAWLPLPVLSTSPHSLDRWSRTLMRADPEGCAAVLVPREGRFQGRPRGHGGTVTADGFLRTATPAAVRLAVLCSPFERLSMGLLHLFRQELVPQATVADVAELLTSGLFRIDAERNGPVELVVPPEVRQRLEGELTVHEVRRMNRAVHRTGWSGGLPAIAYDPQGHAEHPAEQRAFVHARRRTLELLGLPADESGAGRPSPTRLRPSLTEQERVVETGDFGQPADHRPYFFLSYAHTPSWGPDSGDPDLWVHRFFQDLCQTLVQLVDLPAGVAPGFMDRALRSGAGWPEALSENLARCRVLVPLLSPRYFVSESCGKEWYAFNERQVRARSLGPAQGPAIVPVRWAQFGHHELPVSVRDTQVLHDEEELGDRYQEFGIYGLIKLRRLRDEYDEVVFRLARRIVQVARESAPPAARPRPFETTPSAFRPRGEGPRRFRLRVAALTRDTTPDHRDVRPYGAEERDWNPYHGESVRPLADVAVDLIQSLDYHVTVSSFGDGADADDDPASAVPTIVLIDRWALTDDEVRRRLAEFDTRARPWTSVMVPWSRSDLQNMGDEGRRFADELERVLPSVIERGRRSDVRGAVNGVPTLQAFTDVLPAVVAHTNRLFLKHAEAHPPPGPRVTRFRMGGES